MLDLEEKELKRLGKRDKIVEKFERKLNELNDWDKFKSDMSMEEKQRLVQNTELYHAEKKAMETGRKEQQMEIAKRLLSMDMPLEDIEKITELPVEELQEIVNDG